MDPPRLRGRQRRLFAAARPVLDPAGDLLRLPGGGLAGGDRRRDRLHRPRRRPDPRPLGGLPFRFAARLDPWRRGRGGGRGRRGRGPGRRRPAATELRPRPATNVPRWSAGPPTGSPVASPRRRSAPGWSSSCSPAACSSCCFAARAARALSPCSPRWSRSPGPRPAAPLRVAAPFAALVATGSVGDLVWTSLKVGALSFGGGFVIVPLMQGDAVHAYHWMTNTEFLNAVALGQVTPGPVVATVAAVGYGAYGIPGGLLAALVAFLPLVLLHPARRRPLRAPPRQPVGARLPGRRGPGGDRRDPRPRRCRWPAPSPSSGSSSSSPPPRSPS